MSSDPPPGLTAAVVAFIASLAAHADHEKKQVGPCVYCAVCVDEQGRSVRLFQGRLNGEDEAPWDHNIEEPDYEDWLAYWGPSDEDDIDTECPICHADGACGYDQEGRPLIHSVNVDAAAESAVEEVVGGA